MAPSARRRPAPITCEEWSKDGKLDRDDGPAHEKATHDRQLSPRGDGTRTARKLSAFPAGAAPMQDEIASLAVELKTAVTAFATEFEEKLESLPWKTGLKVVAPAPG